MAPATVSSCAGVLYQSSLRLPPWILASAENMRMNCLIVSLTMAL